jgi:16S rRNA (cytosine967-C5)-methyltransferase
MTGARAAAVRVLVAVERGQTTLADELERARADLADRRDRGLLFEISAGVLRWRQALDAVLARASARPIETLDPAVRAILRAGAYQLRRLDRVPAHAVVSESVEAARLVGQKRAAGFVNAVLRAVGRGRDADDLPARPADPGHRPAWLAYLSITLSHPEWLVARWVDRYGVEAAERWCQFNNAPPRVTLRLGSDVDRAAFVERLTAMDIPAEPGRYTRTAVHVAPGGTGRVPPELRDAFVIQDEGSQVVAHVAAGCGGARVLDLCASPGGKTLILSEHNPAAVHLVACDLRPTRVALLRSTLARSARPVAIVRLDAGASLPFGPVFDTVLLDAPCSGLGTLRRDPDLKWSRQPDDLDRLARSERQLLQQAATAVAPGGALVYATCSSEPEENEDIVSAFLAAHPDFAPAPVTFPATVGGGQDLLDDHGRLRTLPFRHDLDAFFAAVLRRRGTP